MTSSDNAGPRASERVLDDKSTTLEPLICAHHHADETAMPPPVRLQFWFEYNSLYSYVAAVRIHRTLACQVKATPRQPLPRGVLKTQGPLSVDFCPFLLGPVFQANHGQPRGPIMTNPVRSNYAVRDVQRICQQEHIPFHGYPSSDTPEPINSVLASRLTLLLLQCVQPANSSDRCPVLAPHHQYLVSLWVTTVYAAFFVNHRDVGKPKVLEELLVQILPQWLPALDQTTWDRALLGLASDQPLPAIPNLAGLLVQTAQTSAPLKAQLKAQTDEAMAQGLFGAPSFVTADGELFWGNDRLDQAVQWPWSLKSAHL
ncbi:hypothetical protein H4R34_000140 [Dimargaris verticillata]|uniref:DSBA-like thioredoxin domain-containing protein n=1 Tax=Dimargaris verticillata TaxID=2761393 RepID=A0A9W8EC40_9FUNG|nr:hypothetical protein H4R34_000140 [Dimargaris verticillata]